MMAAFVFIQAAVSGGWDALRTLHGALHAVPGVKTVHFLAGPTDVVVFVEAADQKALADTLGKIREAKGVAGTDTRIVWPL